jgi:putative CocE/NonD family hydrolase
MDRWFRELLKGEDTGFLREAPVKLFIMGDNRWRDEQEWPLSRAAETSFYLRSGGALSREAPADEAADSYRYDPWNPLLTPTRAGYSRSPVDTTTLEEREDVLVTRRLLSKSLSRRRLHPAPPSHRLVGSRHRLHRKLLDVSPTR